MADTTGKCTNYSACGLAYRNEAVPIVGAAVCPECGRPLTPEKMLKGRTHPALIVICGALILLATVGGVVALVHRHPTVPPQDPASAAPATPPDIENAGTPAPAASNPIASTEPVAATPAPAPAAPEPTSTPAPAAPPSPDSIAPASTPVPAAPIIAGLAPPPTTADDAPEPVKVEKTINVEIKGAGGDENDKVRQEVLKRIDVMPNISPSERDKLYSRVNHARGMGKVITIPFAAGVTSVDARSGDQIKTALSSPQVAGLVKDPAVVFVLLGFADTRGDDRLNQKLSLDRAESVSRTLKNKCGLLNLIQAVGMGGSALFDSENYAKNRVVEVWAVVP